MRNGSSDAARNSVASFFELEPIYRMGRAPTCPPDPATKRFLVSRSASTSTRWPALRVTPVMSDLYRPAVDLLVRHAWIVTMDPERRIFRDGAIAIRQ
ncbi:MAG: hypothetical protein QM744_02495 [Mesorhizobium sp.]